MYNQHDCFSIESTPTNTIHIPFIQIYDATFAHYRCNFFTSTFSTFSQLNQTLRHTVLSQRMKTAFFKTFAFGNKANATFFGATCVQNKRDFFSVFGATKQNDDDTSVKSAPCEVFCIRLSSTSLHARLMPSSATVADDVMSRLVATVVHPTHMSTSGDVTTALGQRRVYVQSRRK